MADYFNGYYFKHQKGDKTLCIIAGKSNSKKFIQIITENFSVQVPYTNQNSFTKKGIKLNIHTEEITLTGEIKYGELSPIKYDIMGLFKYFPMECSHGIVSMYHRLTGQVQLNGEIIDFTGGVGYIEKDSGRSFPASYVWVHANDFDRPISIMASVADIPFCKMNFRGCICVIHYAGREYRLATYLGVKVLVCTKNRIVLKQGKYRIEIKIKECGGQKLTAPKNGEMSRIILETASCGAEFVFHIKKKCVFHLYSNHTSFEYEQ